MASEARTPAPKELGSKPKVRMCLSDDPPFTVANLIANLLLDAMEKRENSYDYAQQLVDLDKTQKEKQEARAADPGNNMADVYINHCRPNGYYTIDLLEAAQQVCAAVNEPDLAEAIWGLMVGTWNESGDWAQRVTGRKIEKSAASLQWERDMDVIYDKYTDKKAPE